MWTRRSTLAACVAIAAISSSTARAAPPDDPRADANRMRHFAANLNPFGVLIGRFSADLQVLPALHHAIVATPFALSVGSATPIASTSTQRQTGVGGELGYHYYSGTRGPNGYFFGGGGILQANQFTSTNVTSLGVFADVGLQGMLDWGLILGFGIGLQWLKEVENGRAWTLGPRALGMVGYAF